MLVGGWGHPATTTRIEEFTSRPLALWQRLRNQATAQRRRNCLSLALFRWVILSSSQRPERTNQIHVPVTTMNATINATRIVPCLKFSARHVSYVGPGSQRGLMGCLSGRHKLLKSLGLRLYIAIPTRTHPAAIDRSCQQLPAPLLLVLYGRCWG